MNIDRHLRQPGTGRRALASLATVLAAAAITASAVLARAAAVPVALSSPSISGTPIEGRILTGNNATWNTGGVRGSSVSQFQRCDTHGGGCVNVGGASGGPGRPSYLLTVDDVDHTLRLTDTHSNSDGATTATSAATPVISSAQPPVSTAAPVITGMPTEGAVLTALPGTWSGGVRSIGYLWQRCHPNGACAPTDEVSSEYEVQPADAGNTLRVVVTVANLSGSTQATSQNVVRVPPAVNLAPTISFLSLKRAGTRVYVRFKACDDARAAITVIARDRTAHRFSIAPFPCTAHAITWVIPAKLRHGRYTATLQAVDKSGAKSATATRSVS